MKNSLDVAIGKHQANIIKTSDGYVIQLDSYSHQDIMVNVTGAEVKQAEQHPPELIDYCLAHYENSDELEFQIACLMKKYGCRSEIALYEVLSSHKGVFYE